MCTKMQHNPNRNCYGSSLYICGYGLACGSCDALCECEQKQQYEKEKQQLEKDHETLVHQQSYPIHQLKELQKKYNQ